MRNRFFSIAAVVLLVGVLGFTAAYGCVQADQYRRQLQYGYRRALQDLNDHVGNIETALQKAPYANTATEQNGIAAKLQKESGMAKASLAALPTGDNSLDNVGKFIAQVGDFASSLSRRVSAGEKISPDEYKTIASLGSYSGKLSANMKNLNVDFTGAPSFRDAMQDTAKDFSNFPSLIYDGPFADHVMNRKSVFLQGKSAIAQGNAENTAADFLQTAQSSLTHAQDTAGALPTYNFTANGGLVTISVTKAGGYVAGMANARSVDGRTLDYAAALKKAQAFLRDRGIQNMKESYYEITDNVCLINFAYNQDGILCYPDLVKVGVAMDNGEIVRFQSSGYLMNHRERKLSAKLTAAQAQKSVSASLTVQNCKAALIPTDSGGEALTYEFLCKGSQNDRVLVYINSSTGYEENIFILSQSVRGILVK